MSNGRRIVVIASEPTFIEPTDQLEAEQRLKKLGAEILEINMLLSDKHAKNPDSGERLTTKEYVPWRRNLVRLVRSKEREKGYVRAWLKAKGFLQPEVTAAQHKSILSILKSCALIMHRFDIRGDLSQEEKRLLSEVDRLTGVGASQPLEEARLYLKEGLENIFNFGAIIALATEEQSDLELLASHWRNINNTVPRNDELIAKCAISFVNVLAHFGMIDESVAIAESLNQTNRDAPFLWLKLAEITGDEKWFDRARKLDQNIPLGQRVWFYLNLYDASGDPDDAERAELEQDAKSLLGRKFRMYLNFLIHAHASWGRLDEARKALSQVEGDEDQLIALASIAYYGTEKDMSRFLTLTQKCIPVRWRCARKVASVLAQSEHGKVAVKMADQLPTGYLQCGMYSILAWHMEAPELIEKAMKAMTSVKIIGDTDESQAYSCLAFAQTRYQRLDDALCTSSFIREKEARCKALLAIHAASQGKPIPKFLVESM